MVFDWQILMREPPSNSRAPGLIGPELLMRPSVFGRLTDISDGRGLTGVGANTAKFEFDETPNTCAESVRVTSWVTDRW